MTRKRMKNRRNNRKTNDKKARLKPDISIMTLNVNSLNISNKDKDWQSGLKKT